MKFIREYYDEGGAKCTEYTIEDIHCSKSSGHTTDHRGSHCKFCGINIFEEIKNRMIKENEEMAMLHFDKPKSSNSRTIVQNGKFVIENE